MRVLVTGCAGFIGYSLSARLLARGDAVIGIDNMNPYYDVRLKEDRLALLRRERSFSFERADCADGLGLSRIFEREKPDVVAHLAAQAGVRYSLSNPVAYVQSNLLGFTHILECCRLHSVRHLVYASTSSVYGGNQKLPFSEKDPVDHPVSFYAATKKANELMAHSYSHVYRLPTTGLRFFTVYGPWGRPDMSPMLFAKAILSGAPIQVFNNGEMQRDFTFIDDIVEATTRILEIVPKPDIAYDNALPNPATSDAPWRIYNVGNQDSVGLLDYIRELEAAFGKVAEKQFLPMQSGDVRSTYADTTLLAEAIGFVPHTPLSLGLRRFADWYLDYYGPGRQDPE